MSSNSMCSATLFNTPFSNVAKNIYENIETRIDVKDKVTRYLLKETGKRPMVLPVIIEINQ